jgi:hypothetical protein
LWGYPTVVGVAAISGFNFPYWIVSLAVLVGLGWLAAAFQEAISILNRQGYQAAIDDFTWMEMGRRGSEGTLPRGVQEQFDAQMPRKNTDA